MPRALFFSIFLTVISVVLYVANLMVYEALALIFGIDTPWALAMLGIALGTLSAGFIGMMIVGPYVYNFFTRALYTALATWMGTFAYVFFASAALGIAAGIASLVHVPFPAQPVGLTLGAMALAVSVYGIMHARRIIPARYSIALPHVPPEWKNKKAVWISDLHLGQLHGRAFAGKVAQAVMNLAPDIIFVGGDLYDGKTAIDPSTLAAPLSNLQAPWGIYYITGNHEEFGDNSKFLQAVRSLGVRVLMNEKLDIHGLQLVGVDYHNANTAEGFKKILSGLALDASKPSILLKHEPNNLNIAEDAGISLQLSGHTHKGQQWPFVYLAQLSYKGFAYGLKPHGALQVLVSSGVGSWGPPQRVGTNSEIAEITFV